MRVPTNEGAKVKPEGANATIRYWDDEAKTDHYVYISFGDEVTSEKGDVVGDVFGHPDEEIFFYATGGVEELKGLMNGHMSVSHEDFYVTEYDVVVR
jgi:hypothetical protein